LRSGALASADIGLAALKNGKIDAAYGVADDRKIQRRRHVLDSSPAQRRGEDKDKNGK